MIRLAFICGLLGLAAVTAIIIWTGFDQVVTALGQAGWGILWTALYHAVAITCSAVGWRVLIRGSGRPSNLFMMYVLWLRSAVNNLMPVARIGGELLAVRVMTKYGISKNDAVASTIVELTLSVIAVFIFDAAGIGLFTFHIADRHIGWELLLGLLLSVPVIAALLIIQRAGFFGLLDKIFNLMFRNMEKKFSGDAAELDRAVHAMYRRTGSVLVCGFWQFLGWSLGAGEVWLALHFLGHPLPFLQAFMIEALIQASASAAFVIPGALGVQEAGFLIFGQMLGLSPQIAVALALMRRCRDLILFVPGLIAWQVQEGSWLLTSKKK